MAIIKQYLIILSCLFVGEILSIKLPVLIPGNVLGMIVLLLLLLTGIIKLKHVEKAAHSLINNLALFFIPAGVGIIQYFDLLSLNLLSIITATVLSTLLVLIITGYITQKLMNRKGEEIKNHGTRANG